MKKHIKPADNAANQVNANYGTPGTNKQFSQAQANRGNQIIISKGKKK